VEFGAIFSRVGARLDDRTYVGPRCHLGLVHLEPDVLIAAGVHIPSGAYTHGTDTAMPIRDQAGTRRLVRIGAGSWIGSNAVILADVGRHTIVGAGAVVTKPIPDGVIATGVPARVVRQRYPSQSASL
jgi:acetyltransferase-like isoleucine patch superfamily enzyme